MDVSNVNTRELTTLKPMSKDDLSLEAREKIEGQIGQKNIMAPDRRTIQGNNTTTTSVESTNEYGLTATQEKKLRDLYADMIDTAKRGVKEAREKLYKEKGMPNYRDDVEEVRKRLGVGKDAGKVDAYSEQAKIAEMLKNWRGIFNK